jgi:hypothetical protein
MAPLLEHPPIGATAPPLAPTREASDAAARRSLLDQIARLESELAALFGSAFPRKGLDFRVAAPGGGPRLLALGELERVRDDLVERLASARRELSDRTWVEEQHRQRLERMMLEPERHRWERVSNEDIGERGCTSYEVRPRLGFLGVLAGWWRVVVSSGCPLAEGRPAAPPPLSIRP